MNDTVCGERGHGGRLYTCKVIRICVKTFCLSTTESISTQYVGETCQHGSPLLMYQVTIPSLKGSTDLFRLFPSLYKRSMYFTSEDFIMSQVIHDTKSGSTSYHGMSRRWLVNLHHVYSVQVPSQKEFWRDEVYGRCLRSPGVRWVCKLIKPKCKVQKYWGSPNS